MLFIWSTLLFHTVYGDLFSLYTPQWELYSDSSLDLQHSNKITVTPGTSSVISVNYQQDKRHEWKVKLVSVQYSGQPEMANITSGVGYSISQVKFFNSATKVYILMWNPRTNQQHTKQLYSFDGISHQGWYHFQLDAPDKNFTSTFIPMDGPWAIPSCIWKGNVTLHKPDLPTFIEAPYVGSSDPIYWIGIDGKTVTAFPAWDDIFKDEGSYRLSCQSAVPLSALPHISFEYQWTMDPPPVRYTGFFDFRGEDNFGNVVYPSSTTWLLSSMVLQTYDSFVFTGNLIDPATCQIEDKASCVKKVDCKWEENKCTLAAVVGCHVAPLNLEFSFAAGSGYLRQPLQPSAPYIYHPQPEPIPSNVQCNNVDKKFTGLNKFSVKVLIAYTFPPLVINQMNVSLDVQQRYGDVVRPQQQKIVTQSLFNHPRKDVSSSSVPLRGGAQSDSLFIGSPASPSGGIAPSQPSSAPSSTMPSAPAAPSSPVPPPTPPGQPGHFYPPNGPLPNSITTPVDSLFDYITATLIPSTHAWQIPNPLHLSTSCTYVSMITYNASKISTANIFWQKNGGDLIIPLNTLFCHNGAARPVADVFQFIANYSIDGQQQHQCKLACPIRQDTSSQVQQYYVTFHEQGTCECELTGIRVPNGNDNLVLWEMDLAALMVDVATNVEESSLGLTTSNDAVEYPQLNRLYSWDQGSSPHGPMVAWRSFAKGIKHVNDYVAFKPANVTFVASYQVTVNVVSAITDLTVSVDGAPHNADVTLPPFYYNTTIQNSLSGDNITVKSADDFKGVITTPLIFNFTGFWFGLDLTSVSFSLKCDCIAEPISVSANCTLHKEVATCTITADAQNEAITTVAKKYSFSKKEVSAMCPSTLTENKMTFSKNPLTTALAVADASPSLVFNITLVNSKVSPSSSKWTPLNTGIVAGASGLVVLFIAVFIALKVKSKKRSYQPIKGLE